ncbi:MAG: tetratricopeptide repeat protein [Candidatus Scalindua sp.]|jgi:tetratricopeptide (TPR) repeat protein|nr:tetratricopeptide repeat protein [Candidatus Scalindua sp.]
MIKKLKQKINSLIGNASGFKGIIFINLSILVLVLLLMFMQQGWISKERDTLISMIDKQTIDKKVKEVDIPKEPEKLTEKTVNKNKQGDVFYKSSQGRKVTKFNIKNTIKEADMYFDYNQYKKAMVVYERLIDSGIAFDDSDRIFSRLAESYYKSGNYEKALGAYRKVVNHFVNSSYRLSAQLGLGECLTLTGNYDEARRILYAIVGQEASYREEKDKNIAIEAYYEIADSYIKQAKHHVKKEDTRQKVVAKMN